MPTNRSPIAARTARVFDAATNLLFAAVAVFVCAYYLSLWQQASRVDARPAPPAVSAYKAGDTIEPAAGLDLDHGGRTLVVAVRSTCRFCTASMPFYRSLVAARPPGARIVVVGPESRTQLGAYLDQHQLVPDASIAELAWRRIRVTPTLIAVDRRGTIDRVWEGQLTPPQQREVLAALSAGTSQ